MKKIDIKSALIGALLIGIVTLSVGAAFGRGRAYEYKVVPANVSQDGLTKAINSSVAEGWEFVSASGPNEQMCGLAVLRRFRQ